MLDLHSYELGFGQLFEKSPDAVVVASADTGCIKLWNPAAEFLFGYSVAEAVGMPIEKLIPPDERVQHQLGPSRQGPSARGVFAGKSVPQEVTALKRNGDRIAVEMTVSPIQVPRTQGRFVVAIIRDVTPRRQAEQMRDQLARALEAQNEHLKELDRLKSLLLNQVSHELRTPLTSILGYTELLEDNVGGPLTQEQAGFVRQIERSTERLQRLVDDLLDYARIEAGTFTLQLEEADMVAKVAEIVESLTLQAKEVGLKLTTALPDEPLALRMDAQRVGQVLINFLTNAIKFTPAGGAITVRLLPEADQVRCEVADTGPGIPEADRTRLFQRFTQLENGQKKGGTGLGLSIAKALVEAHGGAIGVDSASGEGSTFWFTLPK